MNVDWITGITPDNDLFRVINQQPQQTVDIFTVINSYAQQKTKTVDEVREDPLFVNMYLQYPNNILRDVAMSIVDRDDSDDEKVRKIQEWVVNNIEYATDMEQYGYPELWIPPVMTLQTGKGDCEDGAYLIMSLALNAGVDAGRLRFYGGLVKAGTGAETGGHGWVAYKRESDDEWIPVDFSYYPQSGPISQRITMKDDTRYLDQFFMLEVDRIITSDINRVRNPNPNTYTPQAQLTPNVLLPGTWANLYA